MKKYLIVLITIFLLVSCKNEEKQNETTSNPTAVIPISTENNDNIKKVNQNNNISIRKTEVDKNRIISSMEKAEIEDNELKWIKDNIKSSKEKIENLENWEYIKTLISIELNEKDIYEDLDNQELNKFEAEIKYLKKDLNNIEKKYPNKNERDRIRKIIEKKLENLEAILKGTNISLILFDMSEKDFDSYIKILLNNEQYNLEYYEWQMVDYNLISNIKNTYKNYSFTWSFDIKEVEDINKQLWIISTNYIRLDDNNIQTLIKTYSEWKTINIEYKNGLNTINSDLYYTNIEINWKNFLVSEEDIITLNKSEKLDDIYLFTKDENNILKFTNSYNNNDSYYKKIIFWILSLPNYQFKQLLANQSSIVENEDWSKTIEIYKSNIEKDILNWWIIQSFIKWVTREKKYYKNDIWISLEKIENIINENVESEEDIQLLINQAKYSNIIINDELIQKYNMIK